ncbi:MAG: septal ring lytic transglycosylase RlpA family protein [Syntrophaceae bacterium]|nr:septal ring lytic transglycosylase RlpA family protein [Syntrophaceae bacterium]
MKLKRESTVKRFFLLCTLIIFLLNGCSTSKPPYVKPGYPKPYQVFGEWYQPVPDAKDFRERGIASWYGKDFHGKVTSNGEMYDMYDMTAAHKTLPLGTYVRVINLENNRKAEVRINDRGPFVQGRIIDLSYEAAKRIGVLNSGTAHVEIIALGKEIEPGSGKIVPVDYYSGNFTFQVGAFVDKKNAQRLLAKLDKKYQNAHIMVYDRGDNIFYRVRVGRCQTLDSAAEYAVVLKKDGYTDVFTVAE